MAGVDHARILYELDHRKPVICVIQIQNVLGKLPVVPIGNTGAIPYHLCTAFSGAPSDRLPTASPFRAMASGSGLSTSGHWDGPDVRNDLERE